MNKYGNGHFQKMDIKTEGSGPPERRVVKLDTVAEPVVQQFEFGRLHRKGEGSYAATKQKFGALAATDLERTQRGQKDRRFSLNPLLRDPLSIEEEERRVIDQKVHDQVAAQAEVAKAKAAKEGYAAGLKQGHDDAFKNFQKEGAERTQYLENLITEAETAKADIFAANERVLMELVFRMAKMITLKEIATDKEYVLRLTRDLIEKIGVRENIRIRINPDDRDTLQMLKPGLEATFGVLKNISVEANAQVGRGGCIIETEWNAIDASIETQLKGVYEALTATKMAVEPKAEPTS